MNSKLIEKFKRDIEITRELIQNEKNKLKNETFIREKLEPIKDLSDFLQFKYNKEGLIEIIETVMPKIAIDYEEMYISLYIYEMGINDSSFGKETNLRFVDSKNFLKELYSKIYDYIDENKSKLSTEKIEKLESTIDTIKFIDGEIVINNLEDLNNYLEILGNDWSDIEKLQLFSELVEIDKQAKIKRNNDIIEEQRQKEIEQAEEKARKVRELTEKENGEPQEVFRVIQSLKESNEYDNIMKFIAEVNEYIGMLENKYRQEIRKSGENNTKNEIMQLNLVKFLTKELSLDEIKSSMIESDFIVFSISLIKRFLNDIEASFQYEVDRNNSDDINQFKEFSKEICEQINEVYTSIKKIEDQKNHPIEEIIEKQDTMQKNKIIFFPGSDGMPLIFKNLKNENQDVITGIVKAIEKIENNEIGQLKHIKESTKKFYIVPGVNLALIVEKLPDNHILIYKYENMSNHRLRNGSGKDPFDNIDGSHEYVRHLVNLIRDRSNNELGTREYRKIVQDSEVNLSMIKENVRGKKYE